MTLYEYAGSEPIKVKPAPPAQSPAQVRALKAARRGVDKAKASVEYALARHQELAAEYWRAGDDMAETRYDRYDRDVDAESILRILHRFAIRPHYDEVDK